MKFDNNIISDSEGNLETPLYVEYLSDCEPSEQIENELSFLDSELPIINKIKCLIKILKRHPNPINFLEDTIRKKGLNNSPTSLLDSFPNLSSAAKEFGKIILGDSAPEWPCMNCMEMIKSGIELKDDNKDTDKFINLEIKRIEDPLSNWEIDEDTDSILDNESTRISDPKGEESSDSTIESFNKNNLSELDLEVLEANLTISELQTADYECEICKKKSKTYKQLLFHLRKHRDYNLYECERCAKEFIVGCVYRDHAIAHQDERPHLCDVCGKSFKTPRYLSRHKLSHLTERILTCSRCDRTFCHQKGLQAHYAQYHYVKTCKLCGETFENKSLLHKHIANKHNQRVEQGDEPGVFCVLCKKGYASKVNLQTHIRSFHKQIRPHKCPVCNKGFFTKPILRSHMQSHITENADEEILEKYAIFNCDECDKTFTTNARLKEHKTIHSGVKEYNCEFCGKSFAFRTYLRKHIRLMHDIANPNNYICKFCNKVSLNPSGHSTHMLTHTGEYPYSCTICESKFRYPKSLRLHMQKKHSSENV